jgi:hypothetical protein
MILFCGYLRLSSTYADVSFYPTELVQYALLESVLGLHMTTAHVAAAMTYTTVVLLVVLVIAALGRCPTQLTFPYTVLSWHRNLLRLRDHDDGAAGVAGQPAWHGADQVVPEVPRRADHERVGTELGRDRGEFPRRAAAPGAHVDLEAARVGGLVKLGEQPPLKRVRVPHQPDHLAGHRLAVNAWRRHVDHE